MGSLGAGCPVRPGTRRKPDSQDRFMFHYRPGRFTASHSVLRFICTYTSPLSRDLSIVVDFRIFNIGLI